MGHQPARRHQGWLGQDAYIDAAHRVHARIEDAIRTGKDAGLGHFPSFGYQVNAAWLTAAMAGQILLAWLKLLALDGDLAKAEPRTLRYRVLHAAARLVRGGRRKRRKSATNWPWTAAITRAWQRICGSPGHHLTSTNRPCDRGRRPRARGTPAGQPGRSHNRVQPKQAFQAPRRPRPVSRAPCEWSGLGSEFDSTSRLRHFR